MTDANYIPASEREEPNHHGCSGSHCYGWASKWVDHYVSLHESHDVADSVMSDLAKVLHDGCSCHWDPHDGLCNTDACEKKHALARYDRIIGGKHDSI